MKKQLTVRISESAISEFTRLGQIPWTRISQDEQFAYSRIQHRLATELVRAWGVKQAKEEKTMPMLNEYTVLLLYPDYASDNFGQETCQVHVMAANETEAVGKARDQCVRENEESEIDSNDLFLLALYEGHLNDLSGRVSQ